MTELSRDATVSPRFSRDSLGFSTDPVVVSVISTPRNRAAVAIALAVFLACVLIAPFVSGLFGALVLYVIARGPYERLARRAPGGLSAAAIIVGLLVLIIAPVLWLVVHLIEEAPRAIAAVQQSNLLGQLSEFRVGDARIGDEISKAAGTIGSWLSSHAFSFIGSAQSAVIDIMISIFGLYYLLTGPNGGWSSVREYIPFSAHTADTLRDRFVAVTEATTLGSGAVVLAQGLLIALAFVVTGLPDPLFWGAIALVAAILPLVGSSLIWIPAALFLFSQHRYVAAAAMVLIGGFASNVEHLLRPLVSRRKANVHPMITLVGALAGIRQFGLIGILLGPLAIALVFELLRFFREEYIGR